MDCPICDKPDIGDYTKEPVICPQCNSDLKGYLLVERSKILAQKKLRQRSAYLGSLIVIVGAALVITMLKRPKQEAPVTEYTMNFNSSDSLEYYRSELKNAQNLVSEKEDEIEIKYIIKSGDSFSKIAYMFYGDWKQYPQIQDRNGIIGSHIEPGDTLIIKLKGND